MICHWIVHPSSLSLYFVNFISLLLESNFSFEWLTSDHLIQDHSYFWCFSLFLKHSFWQLLTKIVAVILNLQAWFKVDYWHTHYYIQTNSAWHASLIKFYRVIPIWFFVTASTHWSLINLKLYFYFLLTFWNVQIDIIHWPFKFDEYLLFHLRLN